MKPPLTPPSWDTLFAKHSDDLASVLNLPMPRGYPHWDRLSRMPPPEGATAEQWWLAVKLRRRSEARPTPMRDVAGNPFTYTLPDELLRGLHQIDQKAGGAVASAESVFSSEHRDRFVVNSLLEESITSSQLEGASTTRQVASDMLRSGRTPRSKSEQMILNNFLAMRQVRRFQDRPMTVARLLELHEQVTEETLLNPDAAGRLQRPEEPRVTVQDHVSGRVVHHPPAAHLLEQRMGDLVVCANRSTEADGDAFLHPVLRAILLHFWVGFDHPFEDGNGRLARALFYWSMLRQGYWLFEFISISTVIKEAPAKYARAYLQTETDDNDLTYFFLHQVDAIQKAIDRLHAYLQRKAEQADRVQRLVREDGSLNHRQIALLGHAVRHPGFHYTTRSHKDSHGVTYATARADLKALVDRGLLKETRQHQRKAVFTAPSDLEDRLGAYQG